MSTHSVLYDVPGPRAARRDRILNVTFAVLLAALIAWFVYGAWQRGVFDDRWSVLWDPPLGQSAADVWKQLLWNGLILGTLRAVAIAVPIVAVASVLLTVLRVAPQRWLWMPAYGFTHVFRGIPVLLMILFGVLGLQLDLLMAVVFGLVMYNTAVVAEILRAGIAALPNGQREAGLSIGLSPLRTMLRIQLPQAVRIMLPALISQIVVLLKDTSLGFIIGYRELLTVIKNMYNYFGVDSKIVFVLVGAAIYIATNALVSRLATSVEARTRTRYKGIAGGGNGPGGVMAPGGNPVSQPGAVPTASQFP